MKNLTKFLSFLVVLLIISAFSACTAPLPLKENPSESASESEALPELSKEELYDVKMRIKLYDEETNFIHCSVTKEGFEQTLDQTKDHPDTYTLKTLDKTVMADIDGEIYHSATIVEQLHQGMFINEVYDLIGRPHFTARHYPRTVSTIPYRSNYDFCAMNVLNDGRVLLTRYVPVFHESYDQEKRNELGTRIPNFFEEYEKRPIDGYYFVRWWQLGEVSIVSEEQLYGMEFDNDMLLTAEQYLPKNASLEDLQKIKLGMTYNEVTALVGTCGFDVKVLDGVHYYYWTYLKENNDEWKFQVQFTMCEDELIVSKIGT